MGSGPSGASREAQRAEDTRRANIERTQSRIQDIFGSPERESNIQKFIKSVSDFSQLGLDKTKKINDRKLKFALARGGQAGGSTAVDQNRLLSESFFNATIDAERRAQGAGQQLRVSDQQAKLGLFNQALGGLDMTTASSNALEAIRNNIGVARNVTSEQNFDSFFSDVGDFFTASRKAAGERRQRREFGSEFAPRSTPLFQVSGAST